MEKNERSVIWLMITDLNSGSVTSAAVALGQAVTIDGFEVIHLHDRNRSLIGVKHVGSGETREVRFFRVEFMAQRFALAVSSLHPTEADLDRFSAIAALLHERREKRLTASQRDLAGA